MKDEEDAGVRMDPAVATMGAHFVERHPLRQRIALVEMAECRRKAGNYLGRLDDPAGLRRRGAAQALRRAATVTISGDRGRTCYDTACHCGSNRSSGSTCGGEVIGELAKVVGRDERVLIRHVTNEGDSGRLSELLSKPTIKATGPGGCARASG